MMVTKSWLVVVACTVLAGCVHAPQTGARYVAMGSSFAAGPGVGTSDVPVTRCARSAQNYAHLTAQHLGLQLIDVSCSGAATAHITGPWNELPPQIDAVTADTVLVTMTIGGNDVRYIGNLGAASCRATASDPACPDIVPPDEAAFARLDRSMRATFAAVRARAPKARIIVIDYPRVLPESGACAVAPLRPENAALALATAKRLAEITAAAAAAEGAEILKASELSRDHDACAADPWMNGYLSPTGTRVPVAYHPNAAGMAAIADALVKKLTQ
jgi:hypothetical protein